MLASLAAESWGVTANSRRMVDRLYLLGDRVERWFRLLWAEPWVCLRTKRLVLRELHVDDWEAVFAFRHDPEVLRYLARNEPRSEEEVYAQVYFAWKPRCVHPRRDYDLAVVTQADQRVIGEISLTREMPEGGGARIGYTFARDAWGQGYATEAATELLRFGFEELELEWMSGGCHPENTASRRVMEKAGLAFHGSDPNFPGAPPGCQSLVFSRDCGAWLAAYRRGVAHTWVTEVSPARE